jgi:hypothetical protein
MPTDRRTSPGIDGQGRIADRGVRHRRGQLDEGLDATERLGQREQPRVPGQGHGRGLAPVQQEGDHAARRVHLPLGERVLRVAFQAG